MSETEAASAPAKRLLHLPGWLAHPAGILALTVGLIAIGAKIFALLVPARAELFHLVFPVATVATAIYACFELLRLVRSDGFPEEQRRHILLLGGAVVVVAAAAALHASCHIVFAELDDFAHDLRTYGGLASLALLCASLLVFPQQELPRDARIPLGLDIATVLLTGFLGFWLYGISPGMRFEGLPQQNLTIIIAHTALALTVLGTLVLVSFRRVRTERCHILVPMTIGLVLLIVAEILPSSHSYATSAEPASPTNFGWTLFFLVVAVGARAASGRKEGAAHAPAGDTVVSVPFAATGLVGLLFVTSIISRELWVENLQILLPSIFLALVFVVVRQTRLAQEKLRMAEEMQKAKEIAEFANSSRLQFLANISHDLRTPLNGILGCAQILLREKNITGKQKELLKTSQSCAEHLRTLINDLLDLSKLESGRLELAPVPFDLHAFLTELIGSFTLPAETKNIIIEIDQDAKLPHWVKCDRRRLHQILGNLVHNAVKFTNRGAVTLRAASVGDKLVFAIKDTGCGILPDKLGDLFKPFHVVDEKSIQLEGTGLGLSISKKLAERMDGNIDVNSIYGKGSVFTVTIPLELAVPLVEVQRTIVDYQGHRRRILIVDDKPENRVILRSMLEPLDFLVIEAGGGPEALDQLKFARPDVIILDLMMPEMDGFELCRRIKELNISSSPVCLALSAMAGEDVFDRCRAAGFADWVRKPLNFEILLEALHAHAGIEWVYGVIKPGPRDPIPLNIQGSPLKPPPPEILESLTAIARRGNIKGLETQLEEMLATNPGLKAFAERAQQYLDGFKIKELADWLDTLAKKAA